MTDAHAGRRHGCTLRRLGNVDTWRELIACGANFDLADARGRDCVHWAAGANQRTILDDARARGFSSRSLRRTLLDEPPIVAGDTPCFALWPAQGSGFYAPSDAGATAADVAQALVARVGSGRARLGPFIVVHALGSLVFHARPVDPWIVPSSVALTAGDIVVLAVAGRRDDRVTVCLVRAFPARAEVEARNFAASLRGQALVARFEAAVVTEDGYDERLSTITVG